MPAYSTTYSDLHVDLSSAGSFAVLYVGIGQDAAAPGFAEDERAGIGTSEPGPARKGKPA
jgi:hypothetical protein